MKKIVITFLLLFPILFFAQSVTNGIIITEIDSLKYSEKNCCILAPQQGFTAYNEPNGKPVGKIKRMGSIKENDQYAYEIYFVSENKKIKISDYTEIDYEIFALNFTESKNGFIKIKNKSVNFWLSLNEIKKLGFKAINWMDFLILNRKDVLGYYANEPGLRLRAEPNTDSEIIGSVRGDLFEINLTKEVSGQWIKVIIKKYKEHPCNTSLSDDENIVYQSEGWLKVIDDDGEPNIWNYTRGC